MYLRPMLSAHSAGAARARRQHLGAHSAGLARARKQHLGAHSAGFARAMRQHLGDGAVSPNAPTPQIIVSNGPFPVGQSYASLSAQQAVLDSNPASYSTPQGAINVGLDPTNVATSWAHGLSQYSTQQQAVSAGIAPGIVTLYWAESRKYVATPAKPSFWTTGMIAAAVITAGLLVFGDLHERGSVL